MTAPTPSGNILTRKTGPVPNYVILGVVAVGGIYYYIKKKNAAAAAAAAATSSTAATTTPVAAGSTGSGYGGSGSVLAADTSQLNADTTQLGTVSAAQAAESSTIAGLQSNQTSEAATTTALQKSIDSYKSNNAPAGYTLISSPSLGSQLASEGQEIFAQTPTGVIEPYVVNGKVVNAPPSGSKQLIANQPAPSTPGGVHAT